MGKPCWMERCNELSFTDCTRERWGRRREGGNLWRSGSVWQQSDESQGWCMCPSKCGENKKSKTLCDMEMCGYAVELAIRRKTTSAAQYSMLLHNAPAVGSPSRLPLQRHLPISIIRQAVTDKKPHSNLTSLIAGVMCSLDVAWLHPGKIKTAITGWLSLSSCSNCHFAFIRDNPTSVGTMSFGKCTHWVESRVFSTCVQSKKCAHAWGEKNKKTTNGAEVFFGK